MVAGGLILFLEVPRSRNLVSALRNQVRGSVGEKSGSLVATALICRALRSVILDVILKRGVTNVERTKPAL